MTRKLPPHKAVGQNSPIQWSPGDPELEITLTYEQLDPNSPHINFKFVVNPINCPDYKIEPHPLTFGIDRDCKLTFKLDSAIRWRWSKQYYMVSGKGDYQMLYGDVNPVDDHEFYLFARYNASGPAGDKQHFNLNIDYDQGGGLWLPITIDPDVGNPKPPVLVGEAVADGPFEITFSGTVD